MRTLSVVGARPQFVKLAPVSRAMKSLALADDIELEDIIVHTGQHYDRNMSDVFFGQLEIPPPAVDLGIGSGPHGAQTARMIEALEETIGSYAPDVVIIYGDTNSTLAAAVAASKLNVPLAHIEAGLRSFDRAMPEENNRVVADHLSDMLFAPTDTAMQNLAAENLVVRAQLVGDVMLDAVRFNALLAENKSDILKRLGLSAGEFAVATLHRAANTDGDRLRALLDSLNAVASEQVPVIFPAHPRTVASIRETLGDWRPDERLVMIDPVSYLDMLQLLQNAALALTDSGGLQKEALFVATGCVTLREETEWTETVSCGANILAGVDHDAIVAATTAWLDGRSNEVFDVDAVGQFGDGHAAEKIVSSLVAWLGARAKN